MQANSIEVDVERLEPEVIIDLSTGGVRGPPSDTSSTGECHECKHCGKLYKTESTLHAHYALKHPENAANVTCAACDKSYPSLLSYQKHMRYKHSARSSCDLCYRRFATAAMLAAHQTACVKLDAPCPHCGKVFGSAVALKNHVNYMHPSEENKCDLCRRTFRSSRSLSNHLRAVHPLSTLCTVCDKSFASTTALHSHNRHKHTRLDHRCEHCSRIFVTSNGLRRHYTKQHEIRHTCCVCNQEFTSAELLVNHVHVDDTKNN